MSGPGTKLKKMFSMLGFRACKRCQRIADLMDEQGVQWCREKSNWITSQIMLTARRKGFGPLARPIILRMVLFVCKESRYGN